MATNNPFKGPQSYEDGDPFYGRSKEQKGIYGCIRNEVLTLLFARSGTGKSSLIKAGLLPLLREGGGFLPVYIHLSELAVEKSSARNLCDLVIHRCREEAEKHGCVIRESEHALPKDRNMTSLFGFIYGNTFVSSDAADVQPLKPVLIFDQLEEIFTLDFNKADLQFLIAEINCLLENKIPDHLTAVFAGPEDESYLDLMEGLLSKQKGFRILFSFREEYLPQFESLKREIPYIQFTSSRFRLEPFSKETAKEVIGLTAPDIPKTVVDSIAENVSINILSNFELNIVEPFLLSLICQKIYPDISSGATDANDNNRIKALVDGAIENYIGEVYERIGAQTKVFIEDRLITSDDKRRPYSYADLAKDAALRADVDMLIDNPRYRLLNSEQFLESTHIEILHDRLLPPLAKRRNDRKQREMEAERRKIGEDYERKKRRGRRYLTFALIGICFLIGGISYLFIINKRLTAAQLLLNAQARRLGAEKDTSNRLKDELSHQYDSVRSAEGKEYAFASKLDSARKQLEIQNQSLRDADDELAARYEALDSTEGVLNNEQMQLMTSNNQNKNLAKTVKGLSDRLIWNLLKTDPFPALAIAQANYRQISRMRTDDTSVVNGFARTFVTVFQTGNYFNKTPFLYYDAQLSRTGLIASLTREPDQDGIGFYRRSASGPVLARLLRYNTVDGPPDNSLVIYGFSHASDFVYAVTASGGRDTLYAWKVSDGDDGRTRLRWRIDYDRTFNKIQNVRNTNGLLLTGIAPGSRRCDLVYFDLDAQLSTSYSYKLDNKNEKFIDFNLKQEGLIVFDRAKDAYRITSRSEKKWMIKVHAGKDITDSVYYMGDTIVSIANDDRHFYFRFWDKSGTLLNTATFQGGFAVGRTYYSPGRIFGLGYDNSIEVLAFEDGRWTSKIVNRFGVQGDTTKDAYYFSPGGALSRDGSKVAFFYRPDRLAVFDLLNYTLIDTFPLPEACRSRPVFDRNDSTLVVLGPSRIYTLYFRKPEAAVTTATDLEALLDKGFFGSAWPIPDEEKLRYGIE
jgi:hypothetical protein